MSKNVHIGRGEAGSDGAKATPPKPAASAAAPRQLPLANVPRPALIGGGVALLVIILAGLWFMFGVGPENSASFAASAGKEAPASPARTAATGGTAAATDTGAGGNTSASPSAPPTPVTNAPTASSASSGSAGMSAVPSPAPADAGSAAGVPAAAGTTPVEVEGSPPANSHAGDGSTWKAGDAAGKVYRHGPASDP